jgi:5-methylcytosine-specific restriction endonuclease McrA
VLRWRRKEAIEVSSVLVLNATYEPLNVTSVWRACSLILAEKAEIVEAHPERVIRSPSRIFAHPLVIRLRRYVRIPRFGARRITRRAVFARDGFRCQYCGSPGSLTVDHVVPRSRGGTSLWDNIVTACAPCNLRKGDRLPHEAGMHPTCAPRTPPPRLFLTLGTANVPTSWETYLTYA